MNIADEKEKINNRNGIECGGWMVDRQNGTIESGGMESGK